MGLSLPVLHPQNLPVYPPETSTQRPPFGHPHVPTAGSIPPAPSHLSPTNEGALHPPTQGIPQKPQESGTPAKPSPPHTSVLDTMPRGLCTLPSGLGWCSGCLSTPPQIPSVPQRLGGGFLPPQLGVPEGREGESRGGDRALQTPVGGRYSRGSSIANVRTALGPRLLPPRNSLGLPSAVQAASGLCLLGQERGRESEERSL